MLLVTSILVAALFAAGTYMMLRRSFFEILIGVAMLSHGTNLLLIAMSGWRRDAHPPIITDGVPPAAYVDPLPQALILTAIVIGFGVLTFLMTVAVRAWRLSQDIEMTEAGHDSEPEEEATA